MRASLRLNRNLRSKNKKRQFKSGLEKVFASKLFQQGFKVDYEPETFEFVKKSHYTPDFRLKKNVFVETKGYFSSSDRSKMLAFREQHPHIQVILVFGNPKNFLSKNSDTTYAEWATKHGFEWIDIHDPLPTKWWD